MSNILVTGGLGTVGTALIKELKKRGHTVYLVDLQHSRYDNYTRADIASWMQIQKAMWDLDPVDYVYHLAAEFGRHNGEEYFDTLWRTNVIGTRNIIELQKQLGFRMIFASTSEVYGDYPGVMSEDVMNNTEIKQLNDYALTKWTNEIQIINSEKENYLKTVRARLFNLYGPGEYYTPYRSVNCVFCYRLLHGLPITVRRGHKRTSTYIDDAVYSLANLSDNDTFRAGEVYNIGGGEYHDIETLAEYALWSTGAKRSLVSYEESEPFTVKEKIIDNRKAVAELGFMATINLEEGVRRTVNWMREVYGIKQL